MKILAALLFCFWVANAQPKPSIETTGPCSPIATGNNNTFNITCGIGKQQGDALLKIMNKILASQLDLDAVMKKLDEIGKDVKGIRQGVYEGYDFNGTKRQQVPGRSVAVGGEEIGVFQQMMSLNGAKDWSGLLDLADAQILKTPNWLTPYLFSGIANLNLGNRDAGIARLEFVRAQSAGHPDYADADRILKQLGR